MTEQRPTVPSNVVSPLGVSHLGDQVALLYRSKRRGHTKLSLALSDNGLDFHEDVLAPVIMTSSSASESIDDISDLHFATILNDQLLTYRRKGQLHLARQVDFHDLDIGLWEHLPARLPNARMGILINEFKTANQYVLVYSSTGINVAVSKDLKTWQSPPSSILTTRSDHFDKSNLKLVGAELVRQGIFVTYQTVVARRSKQTLMIGGALLAREQPAKVLWRSEKALLELNSSRAEGEHVIGTVVSGDEILVYVADRRGLISVFVLPLPFVAKISSRPNPHLELKRHQGNPIIAPEEGQDWEASGTFNPAVVTHDGQMHLFYRAVGHDGISRIGYAISKDGFDFARLSQPVFDQGAGFIPPADKKPTLIYNPDLYASGGSWGGIEDPRTVIIDEELYMSFGIFESWQSMRMAVTTLPLSDLADKRWNWTQPVIISPSKETHKNWVLFPEKINGKLAILHALTPDVMIKYVNELSELKDNPIQSNNKRGGRDGAWDGFVRGAAAPPLKTDRGWLLLYHGMDPSQPQIGYKVGAMLLDKHDPTKVLYRSSSPIMVPCEWYENEWKPGVVYASGAVIQGNTLFVYYGGGDRHVCIATARLDEFLDELTSDHQIHLVSAEPLG